MEFEGFLDPLKEFMKVNREQMKEKKAQKTTTQNNTTEEAAKDDETPATE